MRATVFVICVFALGLLGLIAYSQYRPKPAVVSGFIEADQIRLGSRVGGRVAVCNVREGQRVEAGEVLVELEPFDLLERRATAVAELAAREAALRELRNGNRREEIAQAKAKLVEIESEWKRLVEGPRG